jgi:integrase
MTRAEARDRTTRTIDAGSAGGSDTDSDTASAPADLGPDDAGTLLGELVDMPALVGAVGLTADSDAPASNDHASAALVPISMPTDPPAALPLFPLLALGPAADAAASADVFGDYGRRSAENTKRAQEWDLRVFAQYLAAAGDVANTPAAIADCAKALLEDPARWAGLTFGTVDGFVRWQLAEGYAIGTVNRRLATIKAYAKACMTAGVLSAEGYTKIQGVRGFGHAQGRNVDAERARTRRGSKKAQSVVIPKELARTLKFGHPDDPQGRRDSVICCLLLDHGLRVGELAGLCVEDFTLGSPAESYMRFYRPKVDKVQVHVLTVDTYQAVHEYLERDCTGFTPASTEPLLCGSRRSGRLTHVGLRANTLSDRVKVLGGRVMSADGSYPLQRLSPHESRHYWATQALRHGTSTDALRRAGGWSSVAMPLLYALEAEVANEGVTLPR